MIRSVCLLCLIQISTTACPAADRKSVSSEHVPLTFAERSPLSAPEEMGKRWKLDPRRWPKPDSILVKNWAYELKDQSFDAFVPRTYKPDGTFGLIVWTGVSSFMPQWFDVLQRHKLLLIHSTGQRRGGPPIPGGVHLDAVHNMKQLYRIDPARVYAAGFSAGGTRAMELATTFPEAFRGALCMNGDNFYVTWEGEVTVEPAIREWPGPLDELRKNCRLVLMRGERDTQFPPAEGRLQYDGLLLDGFERVSFLVVLRMGHIPPNATWFEKGINALDHSKPRKPPTTAPSTQPSPSAGQIAQAKRLLATAKFWRGTRGRNEPGPSQIGRYAQQVIDEFPTTPSAAEAREMLRAEKPARP